jgi:hypothetical protein
MKKRRALKASKALWVEVEISAVDKLEKSLETRLWWNWRQWKANLA